MIITRTPYRISFFGGGTDYPEWFRDHGGAVVATSINKYCYITCRKLPPFFDHNHRIVYSKIENVREINEIDHPAVRAVFSWAKQEEGLEIHHDGDLPARSGLGSSSAFTVGLTHAIYARRGQLVSQEQLARDAIHIEQNVIGETVGSQDQISAAVGGFNKLEFRRDGSFAISPVIVSRDRKAELVSHLMLCFTGLSRNADSIAKTKIANIPKREAQLFRMRELVDEALAILTDGNRAITEFGELLDVTWRYKRELSDRVTTSEVDEIYKVARDNGAIGGKLLGAGGGGFMLLFAEPEKQPAIREKLRHLVHVKFDFEEAGSRICLYQPNGLTA